MSSSILTTHDLTLTPAGITGSIIFQPRSSQSKVGGNGSVLKTLSGGAQAQSMFKTTLSCHLPLVTLPSSQTSRGGFQAAHISAGAPVQKQKQFPGIQLSSAKPGFKVQQHKTIIFFYFFCFRR